MSEFSMLAGRRSNSGLCDPLSMTARELMDWLYFVLMEHRDEKGRAQLERELEPPQIINGQVSNEERMAAVLRMGGGIR